MSENKRFTLHIEWYNQEKTDGKATLKEMGQPLGVIESIEDARFIRDTLNELYDENEQLKSVNMEYEDALGRLEEENEQLKKELDEFKQPNCKKCIHYSVDSAGTYCMCENGLLDGAWEMFPFEWDYSNAKNCKEYEE